MDESTEPNTMDSAVETVSILISALRGTWTRDQLTTAMMINCAVQAIAESATEEDFVLVARVAFKHMATFKHMVSAAPAPKKEFP